MLLLVIVSCLFQVLSFEAFFEEDVHQRQEETFRIRQCKIYFYLEDDTIQVVEPQIKNSGMSQGMYSLNSY